MPKLNPDSFTITKSSSHASIGLCSYVKLGLRNRSGKRSGFTIVELLIVIVVIGILATIVTVSYIGITNSAADAAVKADLVTFAKQMELYKVRNGQYVPIVNGNDASSNTALIIAFGTMNINRANYAVSPDVIRNLVICYSNTLTEFTVFAKSKSGNGYKTTSGGGISTVSSGTYGAGTSSGTLCASLGSAYSSPSVTSGYSLASSPAWMNFFNG